MCVCKVFGLCGHELRSRCLCFCCLKIQRPCLPVRKVYDNGYCTFFSSTGLFHALGMFAACSLDDAETRLHFARLRKLCDLHKTYIIMIIIMIIVLRKSYLRIQLHTAASGASPPFGFHPVPA